MRAKLLSSTLLAMLLTTAIAATGLAQDAPPPENLPDPSVNTCLAALALLAEAVSTAQPETDDAACVIDNPVALIAINSTTGPITMPQKMANKCAFAVQFSHWVADVANPLAIHHLGSPIASVRSGPGFVCRRRNNLPTGKLSEHAFGNAIDLTGFKLESGDKFNTNLPENLTPSQAKFLAALRQTACGYFNTVLGPGSNAAHATHLHLDMQVHGKTGNYRICE